MTSKEERIIRLKAVLERTGLSRSTLYRKIGDGTFPRQIRIAARCAGWRESAVEAWLRNPQFYSVDDHARPSQSNIGPPLLLAGAAEEGTN